MPEQSYLLPPSPMDWLPEGHLAYFVLELVGELDVSRIEARELHWQMHQKVSAPRGRAIYGGRKVIAEPVFGQIKQAMGLRRFSLRGLGKVGAEWAIVCLCHNMLKLRRALGVLRLSAVAV